MKTAVVWFRNDLRLGDNPALSAALADCERVIPVYIHAPEDAGDWQAGAATRWWLHHSLSSLGAGLSALGSRLVLRTGSSSYTLSRLVEQVSATDVYWNRRYEPSLISADKALKQTLNERGVKCHSFNGALLYEPWTVRTSSGGPYRVFTPFWRACQRLPAPVPPLPPPRRLTPVPRKLESQDIQYLGLLPSTPWDDGFRETWQIGETAAITRLERFCEDNMAQYSKGRDWPALNQTSGLSPHLHFGEISPRQVLDATSRAAHMNTIPGIQREAEAFQRQLVWREFAHHVLYHFPRTPSEPLDPRFEAFPWRQRSSPWLEAWQKGQTGFPIVDAGMRQLWRTGYMHNRVRMIVASLLVKNLRLPWQLGAKWFWDTLVDADLANNTLGWQWAAGCGADAAPYFRVFNPVRQGERFDPEGKYVRHWVPELNTLTAKWVHKPWEAPLQSLSEAGLTLGVDYPAPIVNLAESRRAALAAFESLKSGSNP